MATMKDVLRLGIVDNDELTIGALTAYLHAHEPAIRIVWTVITGHKAIDLCLENRSRPDVLLADMSLSDMEGVEVVRRIRSRTPLIPILAITSFPMEMYAGSVAAAGAQGIIAKRDLKSVAQAIYAVHDGRVWDTTGLGCAFHTCGQAHALLDDAAGEQSRDAASLTVREAQILEMYAHGRTSAYVAEELGISVNTVKTLTTRMLRKLGAASRGQAIAIWLSGRSNIA